MNTTVIAAQLFTLRDHCKSADALADSLKKLRQIGYQSVQVSGIGPIAPEDVAKILKDQQMTCCITHTPLDEMRTKPDAVVQKHRLWDCPYSAIGGFFPQQPVAREVWQAFIDEFNQLATHFAADGLTIGYHNHSHEFISSGGAIPQQLLLEGLRPPIFLELDTFWLANAGADPIAWINKASGRLPCLHLKDMIYNAERKHLMAPVGQGNLNMPGIIASAIRAGTRWFIVEQDDCYGQDPFDCLAISYNNLRQMGLK